MQWCHFLLPTSYYYQNPDIHIWKRTRKSKNGIIFLHCLSGRRHDVKMFIFVNKSLVDIKTSLLVFTCVELIRNWWRFELVIALWRYFTRSFDTVIGSKNEIWSIFNIGFVDHSATIDHFIVEILKSIGGILFVIEGFYKILCQGYQQFLIFQS